MTNSNPNPNQNWDRFNGIEPEPSPFDRIPGVLDAPTSTSMTPRVVAPVTVPGVDPSTVADIQVIQDQATIAGDPISRMEAARRAVESMGIEWPKTIVPEGSSLIDVGVQKLKRDRKAWGRMPKVKDSLSIVTAALAAELRKDYTTKISDLRMRLSDGRLVRKENLDSHPSQNPGLAYTEHGLRQLLSQAGVLGDAPRGFAQALEYINNQERAMIFNRLVPALVDPTKTTTLRTRVPHQGSARVVRAALSERYGDANDLHIAQIIAQINGMPDDARLSYIPGDTASRFEIIFPSQLEIPQVKAGDLHNAGIYVRNSETGQGGGDSYAGIVRILCVNLTLGHAYGERTSVRHVGHDLRVQQKIADNIRRALGTIEPLLEVMGYSATLGLEGWSVEDAMKSIAAKFGETKTAAEAWTGQHKTSQYPETIWGLSAAITEAAHAKSSWEGEEDWERIGSWVMDGAVKVKKADVAQSWSTFLTEPTPFRETLRAGN